MQNTIILLVENIATALGTEFRMYLPHIVPMLLRVFMHDTSHERAITSKVGHSDVLFSALSVGHSIV